MPWLTKQWMWRKRSSYVVAILVLVGLFVWRWQIVSQREFLFESQLNQTVTFEGIIISEPDQRESSQRLVVEPTDSSERVLLVTDRYPEFNYGDHIKVSGKIEKPENFETDTGKEFDYINYLAKERIFYRVSRPQIQLISTGEGWWIQEKLFAVKHWFLGNLGQSIPEPAASLGGGIVVGARQGLGQDLQTDFRTVGLSHIIVLSGQNLSIIADVIFRYLAFLPVRLAIGGSIVLILLFTLMAGGGSSLIRATIMAILVLIARVTGRVYDVGRALVATILLMLLWNPRLGVYDLGFQLSILATIGVVYVVPIANRWLGWVPERFGLRETISTTLSAQATVLPWIAYKIGNISLIAPLVNVLVVPVVPVVMLLVFIIGLIAWLPLLSLPVAWLAYAGLAYIIAISQWFAEIPLAAVTVSRVPVVLVIAAYVFLAWGLRRASQLGWYSRDITND